MAAVARTVRYNGGDVPGWAVLYTDELSLVYLSFN
jgi:hypothetical protein